MDFGYANIKMFFDVGFDWEGVTTEAAYQIMEGTLHTISF
jgi:hypothetical protein